MWQRLQRSIEAIGADPSDSEEIRIQKRMLVAVTGLVAVFAAAWGIVYWYLGEPVAALIPGGYAVLTIINLFVFARTKRYRLFLDSQLLFFLVLPFLLQLELGGFVGASAVVLWALPAPLFALVLKGRSESVPYIVAVVALTILSLIIQPSLEINNNLPTAAVGLFFLLNLAAVSLIAFIVLNYFVGQRDRIQADLAAEQAKSDGLLLNILPEEVAADLKERGETSARAYDSVTVLFADVVGFTAFAESVPPDETVGLLNQIFTEFDQIFDRHGIEKIRTIGDGYMAASGLPVERTDHAEAMADAALEVVDYVCGVDVEFRVGIHSGPLVAGVIGQTKFQYDIWGDTVNTASRMESTGAPGRIQVSGETKALLGERYVLDSRGPVSIKGKGNLETWWLVGLAG